MKVITNGRELALLCIAVHQRSPNFLDAGPNTRSCQRPRGEIHSVLKKNNSRTITHVCIPVLLFILFAQKHICNVTHETDSFLTYSTVVVVFGSMLDAAIRRVHLKLCCDTWIYNIRNEFFLQINTFKHPNQF